MAQIVLSSLFFAAASLCIVLTSALWLAGGWRRRCRKLPPPPGPKGWPVLGYLFKLGPKPHETFYELSKTYGPLVHVRLGVVDVVVPCSAELAEKLLRNDMKFINRPQNSVAEHIAYNSRDLGFTLYGPRWRLLRKLFSLQLFSAKALDEFEDVRRREVWRFIRSLASPRDRSSPVDISREVAACVANTLSQLLVGWRVFDDGHETTEFKEMVMELMYLSGCFNIGDFLPTLRWLDPQGLEARMKKLHSRFDNFFDRIIEKHRSSISMRTSEDGQQPASPSKDLLTVLLGFIKEEGRGNGRNLTEIDIKALLQLSSRKIMQSWRMWRSCDHGGSGDHVIMENVEIMRSWKMRRSCDHGKYGDHAIMENVEIMRSWKIWRSCDHGGSGDHAIMEDVEIMWS